MPRRTGTILTNVSCLVPMVAHSSVNAKTFLLTCHCLQKAKLAAQSVEGGKREKRYHTMDVCMLVFSAQLDAEQKY